mmetsp:Transcript_24684/g.62644  ORF Transcript_24684/g.62644 Transcript_24684/m.62644 type:complete len:340 (+) Transcript_24684:532-1551(+)
MRDRDLRQLRAPLRRALLGRLGSRLRLVEELRPPGGRRLGGLGRARLRLETLLRRSQPRGRQRLEEGRPDLGAGLLATRDRGGPAGRGGAAEVGFDRLARLGRAVGPRLRPVARQGGGRSERREDRRGGAQLELRRRARVVDLDAVKVEPPRRGRGARLQALVEDAARRARDGRRPGGAGRLARRGRRGGVHHGARLALREVRLALPDDLLDVLVEPLDRYALVVDRGERRPRRGLRRGIGQPQVAAVRQLDTLDTLVEVQHVVALRDVERPRHVPALLARLAGHADARDLRQRLVVVDRDAVYPRQLAPWPGGRALLGAERLRCVDRLGSLGAGLELA